VNGICDWRFVDLHEIPDGPWKKWASNNPFAPRAGEEEGTVSESIIKLREMQKQMLRGTSTTYEERAGDQ